MVLSQNEDIARYENIEGELIARLKLCQRFRTNMIIQIQIDTHFTLHFVLRKKLAKYNHFPLEPVLRIHIFAIMVLILHNIYQTYTPGLGVKG
jgi:hypothetical protein